MAIVFFRAASALTINEIMYNPEGSDNNREFIEIYSEEYINLTGFIIGDSDSNDTLTELKRFNSSYSLIVEEGFNHSDINASVYSAGATIGNNLGNEQDIITLSYPNGSIIDSISYQNDWGADGNDYTLEKINPNLTNEKANWAISLVQNGTPGYQNSVYGTGEIDYTKIEISEFLPNPEGSDAAPAPGGEWIELYNPTNLQMDLKWMYFKDTSGRILYITDVTVANSTKINANNYIVIYTNGKSLLNNEGLETLEFYGKQNNLIKNISYADPVEGNSYAFVSGIWQSTMPTPGRENINYSSIKDSVFEIQDIYDLGSNNKAEFGQIVRAKIHLWKGDDTKSSISLWIEDKDHEKLSKYTTTSIYTKYSNYSLALPIQIYPNCNERQDNGNYSLHIGWTSDYESRDSYTLQIEDIADGVCGGIEKSEEEKETSSKKFIYELTSKPTNIEAGKRFDIEVSLANNDRIAHEISIWSYIYRGNKCYSGEREENKKSFTLDSKDSKTVRLSNIVEEAEPGSYKLKVKILQDVQKTTKDLTETIELISQEKRQEECIVQNIAQESKANAPEESVQESTRSKITLYQSSSMEITNIIPYMLISVFGLVAVMLIWKKVSL